MNAFMLAMGITSFVLISTSSMADHRQDLLEASEELAEACEHLSEKLLVTSGYRNSQYAVEEMAESAHHFHEQVLATTDLNHLRQDYRDFYDSYRNARNTLRIDYDNSRNDHVMADWLEISHTFRTVREIMRYYQ